MTHIDGAVWTGNLAEQEIKFFISDKHDVIQRHHYAGSFFEIEELAIIEEFFPAGGVYADIGANVGNHLIYVCKYLHPAQAIIFEPNPPAAAVLTLNVALNGLQSVVDSSHMAYGLSDAETWAVPVTPYGNLGATRMAPSDDQTGLRLIRGDSVLSQRRVDFIKIDVEGMEIKTLFGLKETVSKWRPAMFIEVDTVNLDEFDKWVTTNDYEIVRRFKRYPSNENFMILPVESLGITRRAPATKFIAARNVKRAPPPSQVLKEICAFTMVYNESVYLPLWLRHYGMQLGYENLYVIDHGSDDGSTENLYGATRIIVERAGFDETARAELISNFQKERLKEFKFVVFSDVDEILIADPEKFDGLSSFIKQRCKTIINGIGLDVIHNVACENPIDLSQPILTQRNYVQFSSKYCKPLISRVPVRWFAGFHDCDQHPNVDKDIFLFHLKKFDYGLAFRQLEKFRALPWSDHAIQNGHGVEYRVSNEDYDNKTFPYKDIDLSTLVHGEFEFSEEVATFQSEKKWFEGRFAIIPDRFKTLF